LDGAYLDRRFSVSGTLTFESGEKATVRSGVDSNLNGDNAGDRTIFNPNGIAGTASKVFAVDKNGNRLKVLDNHGNPTTTDDLNNPQLLHS